ncbi:MAG: glycosyltransferase family 4 protein, partial [Calditrichaeota bacterium]|nr:glycosyltransferase family 4 protein [Calditrichota bacterium]
IGPQLIIATAWNIGAFSALLSRFLSHKTMIIYHGLEVTKKLSTKRLLKLRHTLERATYNIAVSKFTAEAIHSKFQSLKNLHVVQNGIDPKRFYPEPKPQRLVNQYHLVDKKVIMTLARVIERKGHDTVIRAMAELIKTEPQLIYLIAGGFDAEYRKRLEKLISESGLEKSVIFSGYIPDVEILDYYNLCDIYIMVSKDSNEKGDTEGFGITYLEANACEKPVIGSNLHGIPDAIEDGVSGFLIEADDHLVLIEIVQKLLAKPEYARQIGKQGRQRVLNGFTWDIVTKELLAIVENE